jgi:origin recognition complex subunit 1
MLLTKKQEVVYTIFNWAATPEAKVSIIAISNTLDLPERALSQRVASRLVSLPFTLLVEKNFLNFYHV